MSYENHGRNEPLTLARDLLGGLCLGGARRCPSAPLVLSRDRLEWAKLVG